MSGWRTATGTAAGTAAACGLLLTACSGGEAAPRPDDQATPAVAATPHPPSYDGRLAVTLSAGLRVVGDQPCTDARRACDAAGAAYVPLAGGGPVTLATARVHPSSGHTAWTAVLRFDPADRGTLADARHAARSAGGLLLVLRGHRVLAAAAPSQVVGPRMVIADLAKPDAWRVVEGLPAR